MEKGFAGSYGIETKTISKFDSEFDKYPPLIRYMLDEQWFSIPEENYSEYRHVLRIILEAFDKNEELIYDLTDVVEGGWVNLENIFDYTDDDISPIHDISRRIIVITEGSTYTFILERSLKLLYPHLAEYFRFLILKEQTLQVARARLLIQSNICWCGNNQ